MRKFTRISNRLQHATAALNDVFEESREEIRQCSLPDHLKQYIDDMFVEAGQLFERSVNIWNAQVKLIAAHDYSNEGRTLGDEKTPSAIVHTVPVEEDIVLNETDNGMDNRNPSYDDEEEEEQDGFDERETTPYSVDGMLQQPKGKSPRCCAAAAATAERRTNSSRTSAITPDAKFNSHNAAPSGRVSRTNPPIMRVQDAVNDEPEMPYLVFDFYVHKADPVLADQMLAFLQELAPANCKNCFVTGTVSTTLDDLMPSQSRIGDFLVVLIRASNRITWEEQGVGGILKLIEERKRVLPKQKVLYVALKRAETASEGIGNGMFSFKMPQKFKQQICGECVFQFTFNENTGVFCTKQNCTGAQKMLRFTCG